MRNLKIIYWIATILLSGLMLYSASMYFANTSMVQNYFASLNYPDYIVLPLAWAKLVAVLIILWRPSKWLTEWAYAGLFFDMILAYLAHYFANDGGVYLPLAGLIVLLISYFFGKEVRY